MDLKYKLMAGLILITLVMFFAWPQLQETQYERILPQGGTSYDVVANDIQAIDAHTPRPSTYSPQTVHSALSFDIEANLEEEAGHIAWGLYGYRGDLSQVEAIGIKIQVDHIDASDDVPMRIFLGTSWHVMEQKYYYMEFDLWKNPEWDADYPLDIGHYTPNGKSGVAEMNILQMQNGKTVELLIFADNQFKRAFKGVDAELDSIYLCITKDSIAGELDLSMTLLDLRTYTEAEL